MLLHLTPPPVFFLAFGAAIVAVGPPGVETALLKCRNRHTCTWFQFYRAVLHHRPYPTFAHTDLPSQSLELHHVSFTGMYPRLPVSGPVCTHSAESPFFACLLELEHVSYGCIYLRLSEYPSYRRFANRGTPKMGMTDVIRRGILGKIRHGGGQSRGGRDFRLRRGMEISGHSHVQYCFNPMLIHNFLLIFVSIVMMMATDVRWLQMMSLLVVWTGHGCYSPCSQTGREPQFRRHSLSPSDEALLRILRKVSYN